jgi:hypothetical protein
MKDVTVRYLRLALRAGRPRSNAPSRQDKKTLVKSRFVIPLTSMIEQTCQDVSIERFASPRVSKHLEFKPHHIALFFAEFHSDQVNGLIERAVFIGIPFILDPL